MRRVFAFFVVVAFAAWMAGCATKPEVVKVVQKKKASQPKRYFRPPLSEMAQFPSIKSRFPTGSKSIDDALFNYGPYALNNLQPYFQQAGVAYPPIDIALLTIKDEKRMELWARSTPQGPFKMVHSYGVRAASGIRGPKLKQGDRQVPEGIYEISRLNPHSNYHLSMKVNYPNQFDLDHAEDDGRTDLGGDIFIHGKAVSIGCLAMGDEAIEELFVLAAHVGIENIKVIIAPSDPRKAPLDPFLSNLPEWTPELYRKITDAVFRLTGAKPPKLRVARATIPRHPISTPKVGKTEESAFSFFP